MASAFGGWAPQHLVFPSSRPRVRPQALAQQLSRSKVKSRWSLDVTMGCKLDCWRKKWKSDARRGKRMGRIIGGPFGAGGRWRMAVVLLALLVMGVAGSEGYYKGRDHTREHEVATKGVPCSIPVHEYEALYDLYNATDGAHWAWGPPFFGAMWNFTSAGSMVESLTVPCRDNWQGITCGYLSGGNCTITQLDLEQYNLEGFIPSSIGQLTALVGLKLSTNSLTGSIPSSIGQLTTLKFLNLCANSLTGSIPSSIGQLTALEELYPCANSLTGSIPSSIGQLTALYYLNLCANSLTGSIPSSIGHLTALYYLALCANSLTGSIPSSIGHLTAIKNMACNANSLTGSIPSSIGQLTAFEFLYIYANSLTGSIPSSMGQLTALEYLDFDTNSLTGSIPSSMGQLTALTFLALYSNLLVGSIPSSIGQLTALSNIFLFFNSLTGSIPSSIGQLTALEYLDFDTNSLTGSIPSSIGQLTALYFLDLHMNSLTGSIPSWILNLSFLESLFLDSNALTGCIPSTVDLLPSLFLVFLKSNHLSGSIPSFNSSVSTILKLYLDSNFLTGPIPPSLGTMSTLQYLSLYANLLTGTVPLSIGGSSSILQMKLNDNALTGDLGFVHPNMSSLSVLDVRNNAFHGSLPADLFLLPSISVIAAVGNCFSGILPAEVCEAGSLQTLILDGLSTSTSCRSMYFASSAAYALEMAVTGTIPSCLLTLGNMSTLHLSGNQFTGTLPNPGAGIAINLRNLSLSYNRLSGPIPLSMQMHEWLNLDLSSNSLSGTLLPSFHMASTTSNASLSLGKNYFSGDIPSSLREMDNISILTGNIFGCSPDRSSLPVNDPMAASYQCGSTLLNVVMYLWLAVLLVLTIVVLGLPRGTDPRDVTIVRGCDRAWLLVKSLNWARLQTLLASFRGKCGDGHGNEVELLLQRVRELSYTMTVVCIVVLLPTYSALNAAYSKYKSSYAWILSVSMASGRSAAVVVVVVWSFLFVSVAVGFYVMVYWETDSDSNTRLKPSRSQPVVNWRQMLHLTALTVVNIVVIGGMNLAYQYVDIDYFALVLGVFKGLWNSIVLPAGYESALSLSQSQHGVRDEGLAPISIGDGSTNVHGRLVQARVGFLFQSLIVFNVMVMPVAAMLLLEADCFGYLFVLPPEISSTYAYDECVFDYYTLECSYEAMPVSFSYPPPFEYNYRCSNTFVKSYAMVFVASAIVGSLMTCVKYVVRVDPEAMFGPRLAAAIERFVTLDPDVLTFSDIRFLTTFLSLLCTLLTFGLMYPPLGVVLCAAIVLDTLSVEVELGRYLEGAGDDAARLAERQSAVANVTAGLQTVLWNGLWMMTFPSSIFWAFFVFDMVGSKVEEAREAFWAPVVITSLPIVTWLVGMMVGRVRQRREEQRLSSNLSSPTLRSMSSVFGVMRQMNVSRDLQMNELFGLDHRCNEGIGGVIGEKPRERESAATPSGKVMEV